MGLGIYGSHSSACLFGACLGSEVSGGEGMLCLYLWPRPQCEGQNLGFFTGHVCIQITLSH